LKDSIALIVNGVLVAGIVTALALGKIDLTAALTLIGVASAPGVGNVLLSRLGSKSSDL
jgi:hypothetical protein